MAWWCWAPARLQFCTEQLLVQTVLSDYTHMGIPSQLCKGCCALCHLVSWEIGRCSTSLGVCVLLKLGWFMILPTAYCDKLWLSWSPRELKGVPGGSCSQSCSSLKPAALENWSEILGFFTTASALLYNIKEPSWSLFKAIAAIEAQLFLGLRKMAKCPFRFLASCGI